MRCSLWIVFVYLFTSFSSAEADEKSVLIAILARNKAHVLPYYLKCIDALEYDKEKITIYINTNNNQDATAQILEDWMYEKGPAYNDVIFESYDIADLAACTPHAWNADRFKLLGAIRNRSLDWAKFTGSDFYFVIDCDNFVTPSTLRDLIAHDKPIIAPMLESVPNPEDFYSNFFTAVDGRGYWTAADDYYPILGRDRVGTFEVPVVHCTYLIQSSHISELTYVDGTDDYEFVIFSRRARERGIKQYICNQRHFGYLLHPHDEITLEEEAELVQQIPELAGLY